jgi:hypothetical protein
MEIGTHRYRLKTNLDIQTEVWTMTGNDRETDI